MIGVFAAQLIAQPATQGQRQQEKSQRYQQIQSAKIAFFTAELELTPKEAEDFWPLYNEYWKAREMANRKSYHALREINRLLDENKNVSDQELKQLLETYLYGSTAEGAIQKEYYPKFLKIFPLKKVVKMHLTEEQFRIKMIHQLRSGGSPATISPLNK